MTILDTVIVGGGQAGLGVSYFLQQNGNSHVVFEQGRIGESWLSARWDSFQLNTPNLRNVLPGLPYDGSEADGFWRTDKLVDYFQQYVDRFQLPVRTGVTVISVERGEDQEGFAVKMRTDEQAEESVSSRSVVVLPASSGYPNFLRFVQSFPPISSNCIRPIIATRRVCRRARSLLWGVGNRDARSPKICCLPGGLSIYAPARLGVYLGATAAGTWWSGGWTRSFGMSPMIVCRTNPSAVRLSHRFRGSGVTDIPSACNIWQVGV